MEKKSIGGNKNFEKIFYPIVLVIFLLIVFSFLFFFESFEENIINGNFMEKNVIELAERDFSDISIEEALQERRSVRNYSDEELSLKELSQLLWSAQGITDPTREYRTAPSAGATFPIKIFVDITGVSNVPPGIYEYDPEKNTISFVRESEREKIFEAALSQAFVRDSPLLIIITADFERTTRSYGERGNRYVYMEAGHVSQNIYLQSVSLGLGTVAVGAFDDARIKSILGIREDVLYLMPVGKK